jgi:hypothetical protein
MRTVRERDADGACHWDGPVVVRSTYIFLQIRWIFTVFTAVLRLTRQPRSAPGEAETWHRNCARVSNFEGRPSMHAERAHPEFMDTNQTDPLRSPVKIGAMS